MQLKNEKKEHVYKYDLDCTDEEANKLKSIAIERFAKDEKAQLEYAIITLLSDLLEKDEVDINKIIDNYKGDQNGTKNNNKRKNLDSAIK